MNVTRWLVAIAVVTGVFAAGLAAQPSDSASYPPAYPRCGTQSAGG